MPNQTCTRSVSTSRLLAIVATGGLLLGACSGGGGTDSLSSVDAAGGTAAANGAIADGSTADLGEGRGPSDAEAPVDGGEAVPTAGVDLVAATDGRQIVSTAHVDLSAANADEVVGQIADLAVEAGGIVAGEDTSRVNGTRTTLVLRVPPEEFDAVLERLAELGELTAQRIETDEVTEQVVDLESRITTAEASVVRLRALLDRTGSVAEIAQVETELLARETTLETLRGQLRTIERQVALATITVQVDSEDPSPVADKDEGLPSFLGGLASGWDALVLSLAALAALLGTLLPWLVLSALIGLPTWRLIRSRRRAVVGEPAAA